MTVLDRCRFAARWPLIARPRPTAQPLGERVEAFVATARTLEDNPRILAESSGLFNRAALIASDVGEAATAQRLCWQHIHLYQDVLPLDADTARFSLEPIINLARLMIRRGDGLAAAELFDTLPAAVGRAAPIEIDGQELSLQHLVATDEDLQTIRQWLTVVRHAEGIRARASAGRWDMVADHVHRCGGLGHRLFDGRQAVILAHVLAGEYGQALGVVEHSSVSEPWEEAVQSCLDMLCRVTGGLPRAGAEEMLNRYRRMTAQPGWSVFRTRLGLSVLDLLDAAEHAESSHLVTALVEQAVTAVDGYSAREILTRYRHRLTLGQQQDLDALTTDAGLDMGTLPMPIMAKITEALEIGKPILRSLLAKPAPIL